MSPGMLRRNINDRFIIIVIINNCCYYCSISDMMENESHEPAVETGIEYRIRAEEYHY